MPIEEMRRLYDPFDANYLLLSNSAKQNISKLSDTDFDEIRRIYRARMIQNLPIFLADRLHTSVSALLIFDNNDVNQLTKARFNLNKIEFPALVDANIRYLYDFDSFPLFVFLKRAVKDFYVYGLYFMLYLKVLVTNALLPMTVLFLVAALYKWLPLSSLFSIMVLFQVPFLFLTIPTAAFRYYYFVYLSGFFICPLVLLEIQRKAGTARVG